MSALFGKKVLVIGDETAQVHGIEAALEREGAVLHKTTCESTTSAILEAKHIDVIFLNHLHENAHCIKLLNEIQSKRNTKVLPIFALVDDDTTSIEHVLSLGAADYFTPTETVNSILHKVRIVLGDSENSAGNTVIDIGNPVQNLKAHGIKVMIIEDDHLLANLLSISLAKANFPYFINTTGQGVIKDIDTFQPDIIVLDLMLPGVSGFDILSEVRTHSKYKNLPVLIFSNRDSDEDKQRANELRADGFYVKAMTDLSVLLHTIETIVKSVDE
jgi:DNA-binding response OmpR family regulator